MLNPRKRFLVLVLASFLGTFRRLLGRSKDKNFETHIDDISNVAGWKNTRPFRHAQSALAKSETHHFFEDRENVGIPQLQFDA